ncbi:hypothetical protein [Mucilaginibacter sp. HD30]
MSITAKTISLSLIIMFVAALAYAQKLPNIQKESVRAPANIKVDGKATEWDNKFKAQNNATELFYTLSNDDENLYFTANTGLKDIMIKIMRGGITLSINPTHNKKTDGAMAFTYPSFELEGMSRVANMIVLTDKRNLEKNPGKELVTAAELTKVFSGNAKTISLSGIKEITNKELAIYNENGIQVAAQFDDKLGYIYELAVPLKYLSLPDGGTEAFSYQIKVNEPKPLAPKFDGKGLPPPPPPPMGINTVATTDVWGEYTLAKK